MKKYTFTCLLMIISGSIALVAQDTAFINPNTKGKGWGNLFDACLTNAIFRDSVWTVKDGVLTASRDEAIWTKNQYDNFILDLEFKTANGTNSGVMVHVTDIDKWVSRSVEIQIADDYSDEWSKAPPSWQCAAIFGHQPATKHNVKKPGEWNHYTITCINKKIWVVLNGELVNSCDMSLYTSAKRNIDGTDAPNWLSVPMAELVLHGRIGLQGQHAAAAIYFRNVRIKELKK